MSPTRRSPPRWPEGALARHLIVLATGALFAACLYPIWNLEGRWFVVVIVGVALVSISMMLAGRFSGAALVLLLFCVPLAGFKKFFFLADDVTWTNALGVGLVDFLVAGLYLAWMFRAFAMREVELPRPRRADLWPALLVVSCLLSLSGAEDPRLVLFALQNLVLHVLVYLYVSRHFRPEHVPWLIAAVAFAILVESGLSVVQNRFDVLVGLMQDKGAGGQNLNYQYEVPGIEDVARATGTTYDSHSLGVYMAMLAVFPFVYVTATLSRRLRAALALSLVAALTGLALSYSRSAWLCGGFSLAVCAVLLVALRRRSAWVVVAGLGAAALVTGPWLLAPVFRRLVDAPGELLTVRFEQFPTALSIWRENLVFGAGAGNYIGAMARHNLDWAFEVTVHNVPLYIAAELGIVGVVSYYGLVVATMARLWRVVRRGAEPDRLIALACWLAMLAYVLDGMTDPLFREPVPYLFFWIIVGVGAALDPARAGIPLVAAHAPPDAALATRP
jgi:hypothetical protein